MQFELAFDVCNCLMSKFCLVLSDIYIDIGGKDNKNAERKTDVSNQNGENREQRNRKTRENRENQPMNNADGNANTGNTLNRTGGGGGGGGSGGGGGGGSGAAAGGNAGGGRNFTNERGTNRRQYGKREFDRQSGSDKTGVKAVDKRDGAGAHNWGTHKQDIDDYQKGYDNADESKKKEKKEEDKANNGEPKDDAEQNGKDANEQVQIEEEAKEITLDEWKAQRAERAKPQYNIRKAGEGEDTSQWKKMIALDNRKKKVSIVSFIAVFYLTFLHCHNHYMEFDYTDVVLSLSLS